MPEELTPKQKEHIEKMPEPLQEFVYRIMNLEAPYCYAVLDAIDRYNKGLDVPDSVINAMDTDGMQIWVDYLNIMQFVKANTTVCIYSDLKK